MYGSFPSKHSNCLNTLRFSKGPSKQLKMRSNLHNNDLNQLYDPSLTKNYHHSSTRTREPLSRLSVLSLSTLTFTSHAVGDSVHVTSVMLSNSCAIHTSVAPTI